MYVGVTRRTEGTANPPGVRSASSPSASSAYRSAGTSSCVFTTTVQPRVVRTRKVLLAYPPSSGTAEIGSPKRRPSSHGAVSTRTILAWRSASATLGRVMAVANLVNLEAVSKGFGTRTLLDSVSLGVGRGERIGVVGRNGDGKSTLLQVLARREEPDSGRITHNRDLRLGYLGQSDDLDPGQTVLHAVLGDVETYTWAADPRARSVMEHLLGEVDHQALVGSLSGGERRRASLARLLLTEVDLLVLDEPTNHLDIEAVSWLAEHVVDRAGALIVVTHDRWFLDAVCTVTWEVQGGQVSSYDGGYAAYVLAKAERARPAQVTETKRQNLLKKELAWLRRGAPARSTKPKFRIDAANALIENEPPPRDKLALSQLATARLGKDVFDVEDVSL